VEGHLEQKDQLSTLKRALLALEKMQARLDAIEQERREPIAIIGIGCRFPGGANSPAAFWDLLCNEEDVISEIPPERWNVNAFYDPDPHAPGKMYTRYGAFLRDIDKFDPGFFGISPREAIGMDPQQRLLLEVAWEALENAGQVKAQLHKSQTGVFIGIMSKDYAKFYERSQNLELIDAYYCTGNDFSFAPGRLSYVFGLHGPSIAIDTACSSSLVAVHLACQSLRTRECDMALAGGVSLILSPELNIFLSKAGAMSPDGRCKTFDASANGMGRGEGCGIVVLKCLSRALADGDPIHAIIRGTAINHDGPSGGLTVPNGLAQQALLRQALESAQVSPAQVGYVEAHGTGTILGDPIEIQAINAVLGAGRPQDQPLLVGSVKTNLGHLDPAAGVAGLIKTILQLQHGEIVRHLNFREPNPHIAWHELNIAIPTQRQEWPSGEHTRIAGVSAFGLSGVNAHVIVQEAPQQTMPAASRKPSARLPYLLPLSAHNQGALRALMQRYQRLLEETALTQDALTDICYSAGARRTHHDYRLAVVAHSREGLSAQLAVLLEEGVHDGLSPDYVPSDQRRKLAFVFAGQGSQWYGMGRQLLTSEPIFKETIERCSELLSRYTDWSLLAELSADETTSRLDQTEVAQPALFAIEVALARVWHSWGIMPDAVIGHSVGEIAAAHIAGILTLEDAIKIVYHRGRLMQNATGQGKMAVVHLSQSVVEQALKGYTAHVTIAAVNSPTATVISGTAHVVEMLVQNFQDQGITCQFLRVNYAFHCPQMEPYRQEFVQHLQGLELHPASIPIISTVTGEHCAWQEFDAKHWGRGMREAVLFAPAIGRLLDEHYSTILEIGPHPVLARDIAECLQQAGIAETGKTLPSLRRNQDEFLTLFASLGSLYSLGYSINWQQLYPSGRYCTALPAYPWQRERLWITDREGAPRSSMASPVVEVQAPQHQPVEHEPVHRTSPVFTHKQEESASLSRRQLLHVSIEEQRRLLEAYLQHYVARTLHLVEGKLHKELSLHKVGLDSLMALELKNRIEQDLEVAISLSMLLEGPSITQLSQQIIAQLQPVKEALPEVERLEQTGRTRQLQKVAPTARTASIPLSSDQQRLWFIEQLAPGKALYNQYIALRMRGVVNVNALAKSIGEIIRRHEILRTVFPAIKGQAIQRIQPWQPLTITRIDLSGLPVALQESLALELAEEEARQPLSLEHGPLVKTSLLQLQPDAALLLIIFHHIIIDAWSAGIFYRELAALYAAYSAGMPAPLSEPALQYADFVMWQRQWLQEPAVIEQLAYWKKQLADAPPILALPTDHPRPAVPSYRGAHYSFSLPVPLAGALKELSQQEGVTLFMTLLGAWQVLLHRYTNQDDILIGTPIANRPRSELEQSIGFFINTLVLRSNLAGNPSFRQFLQQVRQVTLDAYAHQDVPFDWIVNALQLPRDLSHSPLFQVMFVLEKESWSEAALSDLDLCPVEIESGRAIFDLTLSIVHNGQGLQGSLEYSTDLFAAATIAALIDHWRVLLENIAVNPDQRLRDLPLLAAAERERMLAATRVAGTASTTVGSVQALFEAQVERTPQATAVLDGDREISYKELNRRANQLAHYLQACGVGPEVRVGLCLERSLELLVGVLGILKAGGAYVPLDPTYPAERLDFMLADAQITVLLTQKKLAAIAQMRIGKILYLDTDWERIAQEQTHNPVQQAGPDNLAYVIYTSGSTGRPKGVAMPHGPLTNLIEWQCHTSASSQITRTLQFTTISFDVAFQEIFATWASGGTLVLISEALRRDMPLLARFIGDKNIERLFLPFVALQQLAEVFSVGETIPASLKEVITAGEQLQITQQVRSFFNQAANCSLYNQYGPSESHVVTAFALDKCPETWASLPPIGRPIDKLELYVLDEQLQLVPTGVIGALYIGGVGLARGYLNQPELTAERFIPHLFSQEPGRRLYRTGDLARYRTDGNLEFLGRYDTQVKLRGFRIELGEIEIVLTRHPSIRESVVLLREDNAGEKSLVAYVLMSNRDGAERPSIDELQQYLYARLPEYMVPSAFVVLDTFPLTPSGKVDRRALPMPDDTSRVRTATFVGPRTQTEEILAHIWAEVLHLERVSIHENFFVLGGHSLLATQLLARVCASFQVELSLQVLFEAPTIAKLSEYVELARSTEQDRTIPPLVAVTKRENLPLSFAQQRLWFLDQFEPLSAAYNIPTALRLQGVLQLDILERSLQQIVQRHEALRTTFANRDGHSVQIVASSLTLELPLLNLEPISLHEQETEVQRLANEEALRPFDLVHGPLIRVTLLRQHPGLHVLLITMHHIVCDGWSIGIFVRELSALYEAACKELAPTLANLPCQYADFTVWQRECLQGDMLMAQQHYWQAQLSGAPALLELPTDRPRPATQTYRGLHQSFQLPLALLTRLKELSRREEVTLFMTLLASFQALLCRYSGQQDILVGTPIANRNRIELEHLIGFFANTLVIRSDLSGNPDLHTFLQQVRKVCLDAYAHQDLPFEKVVEAVQPARALNHSPLFQVMFVLQNTPEVALELSDLVLSPIPIESGTAKFDLTLQITETAHGLDGRIEYNTDLFDPATIQRLITHWRVLLEAWTAEPDLRLGLVPLLTDQERQQILTDWNATRTNYAPGRCLHELVEAQAERTPERVAVVFEDSFLTYGELNRRANQLAHYLQKLQVGPDVLVGICMERSLEMVVGLLGILKAGGAYVPLDPSYPAERLSFMLADAQVHVLLTQRHLVENVPAQQAQIVCLDNWEHIGQESSEHVCSGTVGDNLAYMIYTSGSTGRPKGAMNTHNAIHNRLQWMQETYHLTSVDAVLQKTPFSFDVSVWEIFWPLLSGARLVMALPERHGDSAYLAQLIAMHNITTLHFVPSMLREFLAEERLASQNALRQVFCSGEALSFELQQRFFACLHAALHNLYGPTEAAIDVTYWPCQRQSATPAVPIGHPIANTQIYVLDEYLQPVPIGVAGELHIGGLGLARGYFQRPDLTAEKFIPDPFSQEPGERLYKTGDLARYRPDGAIEYLGRVDHQVKIRGFRIELEEIEAVLGQHPAISSCAVLVREDRVGNKRLVAYIVPQRSGEDPSLSWSVLRSYLQEKLPDYMLPSLFIMLEALPLTPNGKLNRTALPTPDWETAAREGDVVAPRTEVEKILASVWEEVLGRQQVGTHDNFFALGGDSILSMQIIARASQQGVHFTPKQLFQYQTIAALSQVVESSPLLYAEQGPIRGYAPLTPIQHWFFAQQFAEPHHWNQALLLEVQQHAAPAMLLQAIQACLSHHDALRLRFMPEKNGWRQFYSDPDASVPFIRVDLTSLTTEDQDAAIAAIDSAAQKSLHLTQGPLVQSVYLCCHSQAASKKSNLLLLVIHHLVIDGISWQILLEDIERAYWQLSQAEPLQLPRKTTSFKQWAESLVVYAQTGAAYQELAYWSEQSRAAVASLPVDNPAYEERPRGLTARTIATVLTAAETRALQDHVSSAYHARMNEIVLAALLLGFRSWTGHPSLLLDLEGHGREGIIENVDITRTVGWFTSLFPIFLHIREAVTEADALALVKEQLSLLPNKGIGYGILRYLSEDAEVRRRLQPLSRAEVLFNYLGRFDKALTTSNLFVRLRQASGPLSSPQAHRSHLLEITSLIKEDQLHIDFTYNEAVHRRSTIEQLATQTTGALHALIVQCQPLATDEDYSRALFSEVNLTPEQLEQILAEIDFS
jgi:amino acid adenylation domain-containing protein/non-ribosomal peptide synthase protein (TIGR01720 family)